MVINLAGKSVNCRYTRRARDEIYRSRIETTRALREAIMDGLAAGNGTVQVLALGGARAAELQGYSTRRSCPRCERSFAELDTRLFSYNSAHGWCATCYGTGLAMAGFDAEQTGEDHGGSGGIPVAGDRKADPRQP